MLEQVLAHPPALPIVLPDLSYYSEQHHSNLPYNSDNAPQYHIAPANPADAHLLSNPSSRPRAGYLIHDDLSSLVNSALSSDKDRPSSSHSLSPSQEDRDQRERERREEYDREDFIDRRALSHSPALLPHSSHSPNTVTLSPPLSSPSSAHSQSYSLHHNYDHHNPHPFSDDTANHNGTTMFDTQQHQQHALPLPPHARATQLPSLPSIFTGLGHHSSHIPSSGPYSASPLSSPTEPEYQPPSAVRTAYPRYGFPSLPIPGSGLDRRMSEPTIRSMYHHSQTSSGSLPSALTTLPPSSDTNAYSPSPSAASTVIPATPHSPRPGSSHYNSASSLGYGHQRIGSGSSSNGGAQSWMNVKIPPSEVGVISHADIDVPFYPRDSFDNIDLKPVSSPLARDGGGDTEDEDEDKDSDGEGKGGERREGGDRKDKKTYSFVSLPGNAVKKRPRRRYDEIERLYQCNYPNCTKAYGTLNHLNAHVTMQKHGSKRSPGEFKELRKQWRQAKKEAEEADRERERSEIAHAQAHAHHVSHHSHPHASHPHLSPHHQHHIPHHLAHSQLHHISPTSHHVPVSYGHHNMGHLAGLPMSLQQQQQQQQQQMTQQQQQIMMSRHAMGDSEFLPPPSAADGYNQMSTNANVLSQYSAPYLRDSGYARAPPPSEAFPGRLNTEVYNRDGYTAYPAARSPTEVYAGVGGGVVRGPRRRVSLVHSPYPGPHATAYGYGNMDPQAQRYGNGGSGEDAQEGIDIYRPQPHHASNGHPSQQLSGPGWPPHQTHPTHPSAHTPQSSHHTPEHAHQPEDEPLLTSHVSLGSNRLPPDSTLLTPLPGYEPEVEHGASWGAGGEY